MQLERVEQLDEEAWAGVAAVDRGEGDQTAWGATAALAAGDAAALLLFAAVGRRNHAEGLDLLGILGTASPFLAGWLLSAVLLGGYTRQAQQSGPGSAVGTAARVWAAGVPAGLIIRTASKGYLPDKSFVIVTFLATAVLLFSWRALFAALSPKAASDSPQQRRNKQGNPFEFLQLLASLTKRW
eukprot:jgi/Astpho2/7343/fgenesh1_pm.00114_%23_3_t